MFTAFAVGLCLSANVMAQVPSYVPTNGLVGWWPFNGNANDESGNGNNGTAYNMIWGIDRLGNANSTADINGVVTREIQILNPIGANTNKKTFSSWIKLPITYSTGNYYNHIITADHPTAGGMWYQILGPYPTYLTSGVTNKLAFSTSSPISQDLMNTDVWNHVLYLVDGDINMVKLYLNGTYKGSIAISSSLNYNNWAKLTFGQSSGNQSQCSFSGQLDDIGIWDRLLDECEIQDLYNAQLNSVVGTTISVSPQSASVGSNVSLSTASQSTNIQWQNNPLNNGWQNVPSNTTYSGGNTNTLTLNNVQLSNHNQPFRIIANTGNCSDTSNIASIQIADTCITNVTVYDTLLTTVTDTLIINTTLSLPAPNNENTILIYPNPASDHITIDNGNYTAMAGYTIKIENNAGQQVFQSLINQAQFYVDLSTWSGNGLYFVHLIDAQGNTVTVRKIVLQ